MAATPHTPAALPEIDALLVFDLRGLHVGRVHEYPALFHQARTVWIGGEDAQEVARLWRALPPGESARCHTPPFGVRFLLAEDVVAEASLCWECDNVFGQGPTGPLFFAFDARSEPAGRLFIMLRAAMERALPRR